MKQQYHKKGVSLIALTITVIVMLILTTVTQLNLQNSDIVKVANDTKTRENFYAEQNNFENIRDEYLLDSFGNISIDGYIDILTSKNLIKEDIIVNDDGSKTVTTNQGYILVVEKDGDANINLFMGEKDVTLAITPGSVSETYDENSIKKIYVTLDNNAIIGNISWESTNEDAVKVVGDNNKATLMLVGKGEAQIIARYGNAAATCKVTVTESESTPKITLNPSSINKTIIRGSTSTSIITATTENITGTLKWTSSNPNVAKVSGSDNTAIVTYVSGGTANITVTSADGNTSATCHLEVIELIPNITLSSTNITTSIINGKTNPVTVTATTENITGTLTWSSDNPSVATVIGNGNTATITGVSAGVATITAKFGDVSAICKVTVTESNPKITLNKTVANAILGETETISLIATTQDITGSLTWESNNTRVATVSGDGNEATVTISGAGTATITVTDGNVSATCVITVDEYAPTIILDTTVINTGIISKSKTFYLTATTYGDVGELSWSTSNKDVATVAGGEKTAGVHVFAPGNAIITVTDGNVSATCELNVIQLVSSIELNLSTETYTLADGTKQKYITAKLENIENDITWSSSNTDIVTIEPFNGNQAIVTLKKEGTAIITVTDGTVTATCEVNSADW